MKSTVDLASVPEGEGHRDGVADGHRARAEQDDVGPNGLKLVTVCPGMASPVSGVPVIQIAGSCPAGHMAALGSRPDGRLRGPASHAQSLWARPLPVGEPDLCLLLGTAEGLAVNCGHRQRSLPSEGGRPFACGRS